MNDIRSNLYTFFFILFLPDTWQILMGIIFAYFITPFLTTPETGFPAKAILFLMIATIGYATTGTPARWIVRGLKKVILGLGGKAS